MSLKEIHEYILWAHGGKIGVLALVGSATLAIVGTTWLVRFFIIG